MPALNRFPKTLPLLLTAVLLNEAAFLVLELSFLRLLVAFLLACWLLWRSRVAAAALAVFGVVVGGHGLYFAWAREWVFAWLHMWVLLQSVLLLLMAWYLLFSPEVKRFLGKNVDTGEGSVATDVLVTVVAAGALLYSAAITIAVVRGLPFLYRNTAVYWSVDSDPAAPEFVRATDDGVDVVDGVYAVVDEKLYLLRSRVRTHSVRSTTMSTYFYDAGWVTQFRQNYPGLERYWPDADSPDGGLAWGGFPPREGGAEKSGSDGDRR